MKNDNNAAQSEKTVPPRKGREMIHPKSRTSSTAFADVFDHASDAHALREIAPEGFRAAERYWSAGLSTPSIPPRLRELILLAMHASASAVNSDAIARHVRRAREEGASPAEILDTLVTIVGLANHSLYASLPILEDELSKVDVSLPTTPQSSAIEDVKQRFISARGFWNANRDHLAEILPDYVLALSEMSVATWEGTHLSPKERELICIAIDCTVNHTYEPGLRLHIRAAMRHGASGEEILGVLQLAGLLGLEGYILGAATLLEDDSHRG